MAATTVRRRRRSQYRFLPHRLTRRRIVALAAAVVLLPVVTFAGRLAYGLSHATGSSIFTIAGCQLHLACDSSVRQATRDLRRINIALYGYGGGDHDGAYLTDSIMVVSIQPQPDGPPRIAEISVPRDWYVPIQVGPSTTSWGRLNEAYSDAQAQQPTPAPQYKGDPHGGGALADATLETLLGIHIDHFIGVDFQAFQAAVDSVGGIDVTVPDTFTDDQYPHGECANGTGDCSYMTVHFDRGTEHMDGSRALIFTRSRHAGGPEGTDFARSRRQQLVLQALKSKVLSVGGIGHLPDLLNALGDNVVSDMQFPDESALYDLVRGVDNSTIERVSIDNTNFLYDCGYEYGRCPAYYLYAHDRTYASIHRFMESLFPDPGALAEHAPVTVLDGSGFGTGASGRWSSLLGAQGFTTTDGGTAQFTASTHVIDNSGGRAARTAQWLATYYGVQVETGDAAAATQATPTPHGSIKYGLSTPAAAPQGVTVILGQEEERAFNDQGGATDTGSTGAAPAHGSRRSGSGTTGAQRRGSAPPASTPAPPPPTSTPSSGVCLPPLCH